MQKAPSNSPTTLWIPGDHDTNEYDYTSFNISEIGAKMSGATHHITAQQPIPTFALQTPLMMKTHDSLYINLHEAALIDYSAMNLNMDDQDMIFQSWLTPDARATKVIYKHPAQPLGEQS